VFHPDKRKRSNFFFFDFIEALVPHGFTLRRKQWRLRECECVNLHDLLSYRVSYLCAGNALRLLD
jgi:hypothetical protein